MSSVDLHQSSYRYDLALEGNRILRFYSGKWFKVGFAYRSTFYQWLSTYGSLTLFQAVCNVAFISAMFSIALLGIIV